MPSPHANAHAHHTHAHAGSVSAVPASNSPLPQSAFNFHLNSASASNLSSASFSNSTFNSVSISNPTSRSTTPASQLTVGSRKPSQFSQFNQLNQLNQQPLPPPPQQQHHNFHQHYGHQNQNQNHQQQQYHDPSAHASRPVYGSVQFNPAHRPSHIANSVNLTPSFSSASLPRTSSLLPPPSLTVDQQSAWDHPALHDPFSNAPAAPPVPADPVNDREFDDSVSPKNTRRRHSKTHSRSSSLGGLSDGFRNLNRWSISTASSRASNPASAKRFSRRMSIDSTALFSQSSSASPRRLHKSRPSTAGGSPEDTRHQYHQQQPPAVPPLTSLPPIVQLPSLSQDDLVGAALSGRDPKPDRTTYFPGPGAESEPGTFWDDSSRAGETSYLSTSARNTPDPSLPASTFIRDANMPHPEDGPAHREKGHSRSRSQGLKSSTDSTSSQRNPSRSKQPSQKAMLSRALQKANTAVQLDNAQNFQGARSSYREACDLLHQVLLRTAGDEDKKKLEAIRKTYASRIEELDQMLPDEEPDSKALPQRPRSNSTSSIPPVAGRTRNGSVAAADDQPSRLRSDSERSQASQRPVPNYARPTSAAWRPQHSPKPSLDGSRYVTPTPTNFSEPYTRSQSAFSQTSPRRDRVAQPETFLARPMEDEYKPPPLSPRRPMSPSAKLGPDVSIRSDFSSDMNRLAPAPASQRGHQRGNSHESISWLDPIDESAGSSASSVHSRSSSMGVRRKHIRSASGDTEAEFDAALDDAIEAAYDDGYESTDPTQRALDLDHVIGEDDVIAQALKKVQVAKERVRQSELEMQRLANDRDRRMKALQEEEQTLPGGFYDGDDSDEEERILEEMTSGYAIENFTLEDQSTRNRMPRESDSSELTSRTWHSSTLSNPPTANTVLSPVTESITMPSLSKSRGPIAPPPSQSLPKLPPGRPPSSGGRDSVRDRRLSGTNAKQLKIETQKLGPKVQEPATAGPMMQSKESFAGQHPKTAGFVGQQRQTLGAAPTSGPGQARSASQLRGPSPIPTGIAAQGAPPTPPVPACFDGPIDVRSESPAVSRPPALRKNFSSNSLKSMKTRNLSITNIDEFSDASPGTPLSNQFGNAPAARLPGLPSLPTPVAAAFRDRVTSGSAAGGFHLFDNDIHSPASPGEPNAPSEDAPLPLEPCPTDVMLRPFWLMRALYQTLAHPKGGYISNKLFVPRDAWRVKGVKIKGMEEKASQCDLLTAALQKLARVDSEDADALLEEMQSFENVLEQAQVFLTRRLGNEVGVQGAGTMFKDADGVFESDGKPVPRNNSVSAKGAFSWRRLRSKTSSTGLGSAYERGGGKKDGATLGGVEGMSLATLPMTNHPTSKPGKRDAMGVQFSGPNAHYMAALARLFDAAQTIDQIARQVEDPGLRHADKTQVGLELCTRHAAEFFAFYICRFVLQDLTLLLDKFIKRGSEWVLV